MENWQTNMQLLEPVVDRLLKPEAGGLEQRINAIPVEREGHLDFDRTDQRRLDRRANR